MWLPTSTNHTVSRWAALRDAAKALGMAPGDWMEVHSSGRVELYEEPAPPQAWQGAGAPPIPKFKPEVR